MIVLLGSWIALISSFSVSISYFTISFYAVAVIHPTDCLDINRTGVYNDNVNTERSSYDRNKTAWLREL